MNISQIMKIFDWDLSKIHNTTHDGNTKLFGQWVTALTVDPAKQSTIIFNNTSSEVLCVYASDMRFMYLNTSVQKYTEVVERYFQPNVDENELLNILQDINNKDHDEVMQIDIEPETLSMIDSAAALINITRNEFIMKSLIHQIERLDG
jgi:hypothetical protein